MKILFVTPYYPPEVGAPQIRIYELASRLAKMGHLVSVLTTFPNYPSGIVPREWRGKVVWNGVDEGLTIHRVWSFTAPNRGFLKRIAAHLSFALSATLAGLMLPRHDVMVVESPPLFDGFIGVLVRSLRGIQYVFTVSDLWPESAIQMGVIKNPLLIWASKRIELLFYRKAAMVLALTAGIRQAIACCVEPSKVLLFRNSVDCDFFRPGIDATRLRKEMGVADSEFVVLYAGTFGLAQNLGTVLKAAARLQSDHKGQVRFVLAGDGAEGDVLQQEARALKLQNVTFVAPLPRGRMPELVNASDCVLVPLRNLEVFRGALPTKLFEAMACGKPVVLGADGEAKALVQAADSGLCIPAELPSAICDAVVSMMNNRERASQMGQNGREYAARHFSRLVRALELSEALERLQLVRPVPTPRAGSEPHCDPNPDLGCS